MTISRPEPYLWVTWLPRLMAGLNSCEWAAWFKAHHSGYPKAASDFDVAVWQRNHDALLQQVHKERFTGQGTVLLEDQCYFRLQGKSGITLAGKPDLIYITGTRGTICDVKTGQPRASDAMQVKLYMWALPLARKEFSRVVFDGLVVYADQRQVPISSTDVDAAFIDHAVQLIQKIGGSNPLAAFPSRAECAFCDITEHDCVQRFVSESGHAADVLADF